MYKRGSQAAGGDLKALDSNTGGAGQSMRCRVMQAGMLAVIPDPITCFEDASFKQVLLSSSGGHSASFFSRMVYLD